MSSIDAAHPAVWRVVPLNTPFIIRHCPRCGATRPFASSDRFRVNAQKRRLDVWLIYRCTQCDRTWNRAVVERVSPERIPPDLYAAYLANDRDAAWAIAFDVRGAEPVPFTVENPVDAPTIVIELPLPFEIRLDRVLAEGLNVSRSAVRHRVADRRTLRRPVVDGQRVRLAPAMVCP